jgi:hypothetical protein
MATPTRHIGGSPPLTSSAENMTDQPAPKASERPTFRLVLRPEPNVADPERALRRLLKIALRKFRLKCLSVEEVEQP